jgi:hypothetical protein
MSPMAHAFAVQSAIHSVPHERRYAAADYSSARLAKPAVLHEKSPSAQKNPRSRVDGLTERRRKEAAGPSIIPAPVSIPALLVANAARSGSSEREVRTKRVSLPVRAGCGTWQLTAGIVLS